MHVHIIGGGIIGLCSAWYLKEKGCQVTVIDQGDFHSGTSYGNAGMIVPSHFVPLASPGVIGQGIRWLFNRKSPFCIKPKFDLLLLQWLYRFHQSCTQQHVAHAAPILIQFNQWSKELYREFSLLPDFSFDFDEKGLLMLYQTQHQEREEIALAEMANTLGVKTKILDTKEVNDLESDLKVEALGGVYFPGDAHLSPHLFMASLRAGLHERGVSFVANKTVIGFDYNNKSIRHILLEDGERLPSQQILVAAGSHSARLLQGLSIKLLLQPGKGYSITLKEQETKPQIPTILTEAKVAVTPMGSDLRIGGTLELASHSPKVDTLRLRGIRESIPKYYPDLDLEEKRMSPVWSGYRPCSPDGMPYIDRVNPYHNLYLATGHGMMGMSLGPATGKMVCEMMLQLEETMDRTMMRINRW